MDRLKQEIEDARKEQAEIKNKQKWAMDSWVKLTKETTALPSGHADLKKKERDCENAAQLVKQLNENLAQTEAVLQRLSQNLLFFFEENLQGVVPSSKKPRTESTASAPEPGASGANGSKENSKDAPSSTTDAGLNAFRKNILGYCHKSHGVGEDIDVWREKLPKLLKRAEKRLPKDKVESFQKILSNMNSTDEVQKKLIIWYVDAFPHERKPLGYYEAAGVAPPKKKSSGKKAEGEDGETTKESAPSATKPAKPSAQSSTTPSTSKASSSAKKQAPVSPSSSSSSDDSSSEKGDDSSSSSSSSSSEEELPKKKTPQTKTKPAPAEESSKKKKKEEEEPKKKEKKEESASSKKKPKVEEESEEEEKDKKKHHHHHKKSAVLDALTASGKKSKA